MSMDRASELKGLTNDTFKGTFSRIAHIGFTVAWRRTARFRRGP